MEIRQQFAVESALAAPAKRTTSLRRLRLFQQIGASLADAAEAFGRFFDFEKKFFL